MCLFNSCVWGYLIFMCNRCFGRGVCGGVVVYFYQYTDVYVGEGGVFLSIYYIQVCMWVRVGVYYIQVYLWVWSFFILSTN